ncbi:uncharacterized protein LOC124811005 isoform X2 [Hydra vulgaris]|uniref:uncharacterized protein LOC124811005 isoform X2 n=1 Tax=Hydra vulgaris TaxID=6087 RepID=UPI001F5EDFD2|nr:uncharacterized protein LOC124811005 isoform X2 [Hydra vulgaris]
MDKYCTAVWKEGLKTIQENIPVCWIDMIEKCVRYPSEPDRPVIQMITDCTEPDIQWFSFPLQKVKRFSDSLVELENLYNVTTEEDTGSANVELINTNKNNDLQCFYKASVANEKLTSMQHSLSTKKGKKREGWLVKSNSPKKKKKRNINEEAVDDSSGELSHKGDIHFILNNDTSLKNKEDKINNYLPVKSFKGGRPKKIQVDQFPIDMGSFQQKVLFCLSDLKEKMQLIEKQQSKILSFLSKSDNEDVDDFEQTTTTEELLALEKKIVDNKKIKLMLQRKVEVIGLTCKSMSEHVRCSLNAIMSCKLQININVMYGNNVPLKSYTDHLSLAHHLPTLYSLLLRSISNAWNSSEKETKRVISEWLKQAGKRFNRLPPC